LSSAKYASFAGVTVVTGGTSTAASFAASLAAWSAKQSVVSLAFFDLPALEEELLPPHDIKMIAKTALNALSFLTLNLDEPDMVTPCGFSSRPIATMDTLHKLEFNEQFLVK
jgi:hypothetical protein